MCDRQDHKEHWQEGQDHLGNPGSGAWIKMPNARTDYDHLQDPSGTIDLCDMSTAALIRAAVAAGCSTVDFSLGRSENFRLYSIWLSQQ